MAGTALLGAASDLAQAGYGTEAHLDRLRRAGVADPLDAPAWRREFIAHSPVHHLGRVEDRPLLVVHGAADAEVPVTHADVLGASARARRQVLPTAGHRLRRHAVAEDTLVEFLREVFS